MGRERLLWVFVLLFLQLAFAHKKPKVKEQNVTEQIDWSFSIPQIQQALDQLKSIIVQGTTQDIKEAAMEFFVATKDFDPSSLPAEDQEKWSALLSALHYYIAAKRPTTATCEAQNQVWCPEFEDCRDDCTQCGKFCLETEHAECVRPGACIDNGGFTCDSENTCVTSCSQCEGFSAPNKWGECARDSPRTCGANNKVFCAITDRCESNCDGCGGMVTAEGNVCVTPDPAQAQELPTPIENGIRLVDGPNEYEGRVEVFFGPLGWATVCDDGWNEKAAMVACRQYLGTDKDIVAIPYGAARFGQGTGLIGLDDTSCDGDEVKLTQCEFTGWTQQDCDHGEDSGVSCLPAGKCSLKFYCPQSDDETRDCSSCGRYTETDEASCSCKAPQRVAPGCNGKFWCPLVNDWVPNCCVSCGGAKGTNLATCSCQAALGVKDIIKKTPRLSTFAKMLEIAEEGGYLRDVPECHTTWLVPTESAFLFFSDPLVFDDILDALPKPVIANFVKGHIIQGDWTASAMEGYHKTYVRTGAYQQELYIRYIADTREHMVYPPGCDPFSKWVAHCPDVHVTFSDHIASGAMIQEVNALIPFAECDVHGICGPNILCASNQDCMFAENTALGTAQGYFDVGIPLVITEGREYLGGIYPTGRWMADNPTRDWDDLREDLDDYDGSQFNSFYIPYYSLDVAGGGCSIAAHLSPLMPQCKHGMDGWTYTGDSLFSDDGGFGHVTVATDIYQNLDDDDDSWYGNGMINAFNAGYWNVPGDFTGFYNLDTYEHEYDDDGDYPYKLSTAFNLFDPVQQNICIKTCTVPCPPGTVACPYESKCGIPCNGVQECTYWDEECECDHDDGWCDAGEISCGWDQTPPGYYLVDNEPRAPVLAPIGAPACKQPCQPGGWGWGASGDVDDSVMACGSNFFGTQCMSCPPGFWCCADVQFANPTKRNHRCVKLCDGVDECPYPFVENAGLDEICATVKPGNMACPDMLYQARVCDGDKGCKAPVDEMYCSDKCLKKWGPGVMACPNHNDTCARPCDGKIDCPDGFDESVCTVVSSDPLYNWFPDDDTTALGSTNFDGQHLTPPEMFPYFSKGSEQSLRGAYIHDAHAFFFNTFQQDPTASELMYSMCSPYGAPAHESYQIPPAE